MRTLLCLAMVALAGCATRPISNAEALAVPADRVLAPALLQETAGSGKVIVKRDGGVMGSACSARIFADALPVAEIKAAEKVVMYLPPGEHIFGAWPNGVCGGGMSEVRATVRTGAEISFRIGYGSNGDFTIQATAF